MKLIEVENYELKVAPEALLVRPIRRLWNQDRSERKEKFYQQMSYLFFMVSPQSTYSYILDLDERSRMIIEQEGLPEDFRPSEMLVEAMKVYKQLTVTPSQKLLNSSLKAADTVSKFLEDPEILEKTDTNGRPMYKVGDVTKALKDVEGIVSSLQSLQKKVDSELLEPGKARGTQELTVGDIGLD
jgi:hypothetical protein